MIFFFFFFYNLWFLFFPFLNLTFLQGLSGDNRHTLFPGLVREDVHGKMPGASGWVMSPHDGVSSSPFSIFSALPTHTFVLKPGWQGNQRPLVPPPCWLAVPSKYRFFFFKLLITPMKQLMSDKIPNLGKWQKLLKTSHGSHSLFSVRMNLWSWKLLTDSFSQGGTELAVIGLIPVGRHRLSSDASELFCPSHVIQPREAPLCHLGLETQLCLKKSCGPLCHARASWFVLFLFF